MNMNSRKFHLQKRYDIGQHCASRLHERIGGVDSINFGTQTANKMNEIIEKSKTIKFRDDGGHEHSLFMSLYEFLDILKVKATNTNKEEEYVQICVSRRSNNKKTRFTKNDAWMIKTIITVNKAKYNNKRNVYLGSSKIKAFDMLKINYHITNNCNFNCKHCFGKFEKDELEKEDIIKLIKTISTMGAKGINFAGGEPMLVNNIKEYFKISKRLGLNVSVISNGTNIINRNGIFSNVDEVGISIDSLDDETNRKIGRVDTNGNVLDYDKVLSWIENNFPDLKLKVNIVLSKLNKDQDIISLLKKHPNIKRVKLLKMKPTKLNKENISEISDEEYEIILSTYVKGLEGKVHIVREGTSDMDNSYIIVTPNGKLVVDDIGKYKYTNRKLWELTGKEVHNVLRLDKVKYDKRYKN